MGGNENDKDDETDIITTDSSLEEMVISEG